MSVPVDFLGRAIVPLAEPLLAVRNLTAAVNDSPDPSVDTPTATVTVAANKLAKDGSSLRIVAFGATGDSPGPIFGSIHDGTTTVYTAFISTDSGKGWRATTDVVSDGTSATASVLETYWVPAVDYTTKPLNVSLPLPALDVTQPWVVSLWTYDGSTETTASVLGLMLVTFNPGP